MTLPRIQRPGQAKQGFVVVCFLRPARRLRQLKNEDEDGYEDDLSFLFLQIFALFL